jgi:esterase
VPARLHHERIASSETTPSRWLLLTHGIYGSGGNWRTIARKLVERRPEWGVALVDLRQHGRSEPGVAPHTIAACAEDIRALADELGDVHALAGHSFGGKVMLAARSILSVEQTWVFDSSPSGRPEGLSGARNTVLLVLELLERLPRTWSRREDFIAAAVEGGLDPSIAQWLAMNVTPEPSAGAGGALVLRLDPRAMREMLESYFATDLWPAVEDPAHGRVDLVVATRGETFSDADLARMPSLPPHVHVHRVEAGHWLHVETPSAVLDLLATELV